MGLKKFIKGSTEPVALHGSACLSITMKKVLNAASCGSLGKKEGLKALGDVV